MAFAGIGTDFFGQMKKHTSSPSRNEEWPSAHKRRRSLRWALALGLGFAVVASASISLNPDIFMKYLRPSSENGSAAEFLADETPEESLPTENNAQSPLLKAKTTPADSGVIPVPWGAIVNLNPSKQEPSIESSTSETDTQPLPRMENEPPSQGSDNASGESAVVGSQSFTQKGSIAVPSAPAVGRVPSVPPVPPVRLPPTPTPTPYPIRSPQ